MKSDMYFNICLEQAALSPLRFRHGCIVVKGGKVIGKGFNDFRPGFDGGHLKDCRSWVGDGGFHNATLSMHAEMAAIHAALSKTSVAGAVSCIQPCLKLPPVDSQRQRQQLLQYDTIDDEFVDHIYAEAYERKRVRQNRQRATAVQAAGWCFKATKCQADSVQPERETVSNAAAVTATTPEQSPAPPHV